MRKLTWSRTRQSSTTTFLARKLAPIVEADAASKVFLTYLFSGDVSFMHRYFACMYVCMAGGIDQGRGSAYLTTREVLPTPVG